MIGEELIIIFDQDKAYLTKDRALDFKQVDIHDVVKRFHQPAFWKISVLNHILEEKKLFAEILSYHVGILDFPSNQKLLASKLNAIEIVKFKSIDTGGLLRTAKNENPPKIEYIKPSQVQIKEHQGTIEFEQTRRNIQSYTNGSTIRKEPVKKIINEVFFVPLESVRFRSGGVSFDKKFKELSKPIELNISNYDIREEFDAVKNYFANVLNTKKIEVVALVETVDDEIVSAIVTSPEIERINKELIENVKFEFVNALVKKKIPSEIEKSIFTMDEYFDTFSDAKLKSNTFYENDRELLEDLLQISKTKHYEHLRFLSSRHSHNTMKLRFVHKPFSFLFLIEGRTKCHFIWETIDTKEATYIWYSEKDKEALKRTLTKIEEIINQIKTQGKIAYINTATEDEFIRIYHEYSENIGGFVKWKGELEAILK